MFQRRPYDVLLERSSERLIRIRIGESKPPLIGALERAADLAACGTVVVPHAAGPARRLFFGRRVGEGGRLFCAPPLIGVAIAVIRGWMCGVQRRGGPAAERWGESEVN